MCAGRSRSTHTTEGVNVSMEFATVYIEGRALRLVCSGEGTPTVVIDQGQGLSIERRARTAKAALH
jgi:hypothetical protein